MKKIVSIILFLFAIATIYSQNGINYYEYWFDGNYDDKTETSVTPVSQLTLNENIATTDIAIGLHAFYIRFKDESGRYSPIVGQFFYKSGQGGPDGGNISAYEYWFDSEYADRTYEEIPPQEIFQINDAIVSDLNNGLHTLHIRFKDAGGLWSSIVSQFFYKAGEGVGEENLIKAYRYWFNDLDSLTTAIDLLVPVNPYFLLTEVNATALDTGYHTLHFQIQDTKNLWSSIVSDTFYNVGEPVLTSITPAIGGNIGDVTVNIYGNGFFENTTVMLIQPGVDTVYVPDSLMAIFDAKRIQATFDLREKALGLYDVVVEVLEADTVMKLVDGFEVVEGIPAQPYISIIGSSTIRLNQWQTYTIVVGNSGNVNATGVPVYLAIDTMASFDFLDNYIRYNLEDSTFSFIDTLYEAIRIDSLYGEIYHANLIPFIVGGIPPDGTITFNINLKSNSSINLKAWVNPPLYRSPFNPGWLACADDITAAAFEWIPVVGCPYGIFRSLIDPIIQLSVQSDGEFEDFEGEFGINGGLGFAFDMTFGVSTSIIGCAAGPYGANPASEFLQKALSITVSGASGVDALTESCAPIFQDIYNFYNNINLIFSYDPNDKLGPLGFGLTNSLNDNQPFTYLIRFENDSAATALAQIVRIEDTLDADVFDFSTFQLGFMSFGDTIINIPPNQQHFNTYVDLRPEFNIVVQLNADFNDTTGVAIWKYTALDPNNYLPVTDPLAGFLPPNIIAPEGEGSVFYTIHVKDSLENGVEISNKAYIYFDYNEPIITNEWSNTLDNENPDSEVNVLSEFTSTDLFMVSWTGLDEGSQIENYDIYYSINGGDYMPWLLNTSALSAEFFGFYDSTYAFYSIAKDSAGNLETIPAVPDAFTTLINCSGFAVDLNFSNDTIICEGTDIDLMASDGDSHIWSNGETTSVITISEPGEYYVTVSLSGICFATSDTINVSISPIPEIPLIIVDGEIILCEGDSVTLISTAIFGNNWNTGDTTNSIVIYEEGFYTVEITNQCGTSISDPISIIVHSNPLAIISNDGELEFCIGEDVVLTASEGENYLWNNGENTESIVVTESDTLFVTITDLNGCTATSDSVVIIAHPLPEIPIIANSNDTLYTLEGYTYQWFIEGVIILGATNYFFVASEEGNYKVIITDINECSSTSADFYLNFVAIENVNYSIDNLNVFPNPNDGKYTLEFNSECNSELFITVYDALGRMILEDKGKVEDNLFRKNYDLSGYAEGSYIVKVVCDDGAHYENIIVQ